MTAIINRTPTGRIISLHAEIKYLWARYRDKSFPLKGLKYDDTAKENPLTYFVLAKRHPTIGIYDPYLDNPLSPAKFHLTQSIQYDTQKSKSASECLNALEALGWVKKNGNLSNLTNLGIQIAEMEYEDKKFLNALRESVLGYGIFVGFLYKCSVNLSNGIVDKNKIEIGYQDTHEVVNIAGQNIPLSTGSQKDTIVRTRSTLFAWAVTSGFSLPYNFPVPKDKLKWHVNTLEEIALKHWGWNRMKMFIPDDLFNGNHKVNRPLSYRWMTKSTRALRERGQEIIRRTSIEEEEKVKNRRFGIVYSLALAAKHKVSIEYTKLIQIMLTNSQLYVVNKNDFERVMQIEKDIAIIAGIPFRESDGILTPLTQLNIDYLIGDAPDAVINSISDIFPKIIK